jgi:hypothetical protein
MNRLRAWLPETHGPRFELLRHFLGTMFESDMLAVSGEWRKAVTGFFAALVSLGLVVVQTYSERYTSLQLPPSTPLIYRQELRSDEFLFIGIVMAFTALLTLPQWQAQFPGLRDCLALAALPVSAGEVFVAKFGAVLLVFSGCAVALNLPWAILFVSASSGHWQQNPSALAIVPQLFRHFEAASPGSGGESRADLPGRALNPCRCRVNGNGSTGKTRSLVRPR